MIKINIELIGSINITREFLTKHLNNLDKENKINKAYLESIESQRKSKPVVDNQKEITINIKTINNYITETMQSFEKIQADLVEE